MLAALVILGVALVAAEKISIDPATHNFVDDSGRVRIFHGMNAVYKIAPWHPTTTGFDTTSTLSDIDAANLKSWGFNVVRLGVMWPGVEPTQNNYNSTYLDEIATIVDHLSAQNIYVILDFHQDLLHRKWCGEGVPDYIYDICHTSQPEDTPEFPLPSVNTTYPTDENGDPTLDACLSHMFATYYMSAEVSAGFECLYINTDVQTAFAAYWKVIVTRFKDMPYVLGYELINEPWMGDIFHHHADLIPKYTEQHYLQPMYQYLHSVIRSLDTQKIIFYEGLTIDYWENGFTATPGGEEYNDRQALAYHIYCPIQDPTVPMEVACNLINTEFFSRRANDVARLGGGMMMTEFGAAEDIKGDMYALEQTCELADKHQQSWIYWQFKYYEDITTCTPSGESLYNNDGSLCENKVRILSRTYPQAVAGTIQNYSFNLNTAKFSLSYTTSTAASSATAPERTTVLYYNRDVHYPGGVVVRVNDGVSVSCDDLYVTLLHDDAMDVSVTITRCEEQEICTC